MSLRDLIITLKLGFIYCKRSYRNTLVTSKAFFRNAKLEVQLSTYIIIILPKPVQHSAIGNPLSSKDDL